MKIPLSLLGCIGLYLVLGSVALRGDDGEDPGGIYYPLEPAKLLSLLPGAPKNWKLVASKAKERLSYALQPETYALRQYLFVPSPPPLGSAASPAPPAKVVFVSLLDTGGDPERLRAFRDFKPGGAPQSTNGSQYSSNLIEGLPATQIDTPTQNISTIKVSNRFLLVLRVSNLEQEERDQWVSLLKLNALTDASAKAPQMPLISGLITLETINELNPAANGKLTSSFETKADLKKAQKRAL
jgi:hypothetical protein